MVFLQSSCSTLSFIKKWRRKGDKCGIQSSPLLRISRKDTLTRRTDSKESTREMLRSPKNYRRRMMRKIVLRNKDNLELEDE
jgi:hypothetical protein